jgi:hypothetical protein
VKLGAADVAVTGTRIENSRLSIGPAAAPRIPVTRSFGSMTPGRERPLARRLDPVPDLHRRRHPGRARPDRVDDDARQFGDRAAPSFTPARPRIENSRLSIGPAAAPRIPVTRSFGFDSLLFSILGLAGVKLGAADVAVTGTRCGGAVLVQ